MSADRNIVIYHNHCTDGAAAAQTFRGCGHPAAAGLPLPSQKPETLTPPH